ncbi:hypothetical protein Thein_0490 [Thermodesulfatator indicus DSM 15286]|uniref:Uncharacterized protein n=1 Tax=Thermodesulfatator indicus (strain DSM 15286 / JCM 11887 / CIR29812) TaxID=667014 RepID=F8AB06_THEID|nr:hypothetical protein Thein_0490 [Thermodesulfatator indicus DSM 15286]
MPIFLSGASPQVIFTTLSLYLIEYNEFMSEIFRERLHNL